MPKLMKHPQHGFHYAQGAEEVEMRKNGWLDADNFPASPEPEKVESTAVPAPVLAPEFDRDALIALADDKGVKVDKRWSDERLAAEIEKA